jgi:type VI secretion system protein VasD
VNRDDLAQTTEAPYDARRRRASALGFLALTGLLGSGCSNPFKAPPPPPTIVLPPPPPPPKMASVAGSVVAAADLNPSVTQRPSPLVLRIYELKSDAAFNQTDFMALFQSEQAALGADLVAMEELTLLPGESRPIEARPLHAETRFIGVFAAYRNLERARWRAVAPVQAGVAHKLTIRAAALAVTAEIQP